MTDEIQGLSDKLQVAKEALEKLSKLGNGERLGNSKGNAIAITALDWIANPPCEHDTRFKGVMRLPDVDRGCLACALERTAAEVDRQQAVIEVWQDGAKAGADSHPYAGDKWSPAELLAISVRNTETERLKAIEAAGMALTAVWGQDGTAYAEVERLMGDLSMALPIEKRRLSTGKGVYQQIETGGDAE